MARRASARVKEGVEQQSIGEAPPSIAEDIEIDLDSPLPATAAPETPEVPEIEVETAPATPEPADDAEALRKRVQELEAAEALHQQNLAQLQATAQQLYQTNQQSQQQANQAQWNALRAEYDGTVNGIAAANSEIGALKEQIRQAGAEGNWDVIAEAQAQIGNLSYDLRRLEDRKGQLDNYAKQLKQRPPQQQQRQPQVQQQPSQDPVEATISAAPIPDRAKTWLRQHRDFMTDPEKNAKLQDAHWEAKAAAGGEYTNAYFDKMESLLGLRQSSPSVQAPPSRPNGSAGAAVSAPPTREAPSMSTGKAPSPTRVTLTAEEREVARSIAEVRNITQAEAEREYARQKLNIQKTRSN